MRNVWKELRFAVRSLRRSPGFAVVAMLTMGLGIGANTAIFSIVNTVLLEPLPFDQPDRLVQLQTRYLPGGGTGWISAPEWWEYRKEQTSFERMVVISPDNGNLTGLPTPLRLQGMRVSPGYFPMLRVQPALGRGFISEEEEPGQSPVVIISDGLWKSAFGADPGVVGSALQLGGITRTIVGVTPPEHRPLAGYLFAGRKSDYWIPVVLDPSTFDERTVERHGFLGIARLAEGVDPLLAESGLMEGVRRLESLYPGISNSGSRNVAVGSLRERVVGDARGTLFLLAVAVALVLLVACVNVANLLIARADSRESETAVRAALGASRTRLLSHALAESVVIGVGGGLAGAVITVFGRGALSSLMPTDMAIPSGIGVGLPLVGFTIALSVVAGLVAGLLPALRLARGDVFGAVKAGGRAGSENSGKSLLRRALVVGQVAGAVVLVSSAALLVRSLATLNSVDPGFDATNLYMVQINATRANYGTTEAVTALYAELEQRTGELPAVVATGSSWQTPLQTGMSDWPVMPQQNDESSWVSADPNVVSPDYFETYGITVLAGRTFETGDTQRAVGGVVLSRAAAEAMWGDESALGRRVNLSFGTPVWREVIGVVDDVRIRGLGEEPRPQTYMTFGEGPWSRNPSLKLTIRTTASVAELRQSLLSIVQGIDADIPLGPIQPMAAEVARSLERERLVSVLISVFAAVALLLGAIGVYGMISYSVHRRTREIGLRIAMGANPTGVLGMVVRQGLALGAVGVGVGLLGSVLSGRLLEGFLFGISRTDVATLTVVSVAVLAVAAVASFLPARRASSVDPLEALRE